jgi:hypothetical protein
MENYNNAIKHITENFKSVKEIAKLIGHKNHEQLANELEKYSDLEVINNNDFGDPNYLVRIRKIEKTTYTHNEQTNNIHGDVKESNLVAGTFFNNPQQYVKEDKHNEKETIYSMIIKFFTSILNDTTYNKKFILAVLFFILIITLLIRL